MVLRFDEGRAVYVWHMSDFKMVGVMGRIGDTWHFFHEANTYQAPHRNTHCSYPIETRVATFLYGLGGETSQVYVQQKKGGPTLLTTVGTLLKAPTYTYYKRSRLYLSDDKWEVTERITGMPFYRKRVYLEDEHGRSQ